MSPRPNRVFLGVTGASGALYGLRTLQMLLQAGVEVDLVYSPAAKRVLFEECGLVFDRDPGVLFQGLEANGCRCFEHGDIGAPPASGTALGEAVLIAPCSLSTLAAVAQGRAGNLIERAAQVALKESRRLVLVPRETPLSRTHLDQMSRLAWAGATLLPACPGFYHQPQTVLDLVDHVCAKILDLCRIPQDRVPPWSGGEGSLPPT
ncbi:MAG: UbiX family flavin prenyltransferase [Planctomycetota bacterium]|nr:MAG: UbiX family flavin prenyltransferase [Planctomycetota bacterium]